MTPMLQRHAVCRLAGAARSPVGIAAVPVYPPFPVRVPRRTLFGRKRREARLSSRNLETLDVQRMSKQAADYHRQRQIFLWSGAIAGVISFIYTAWKLKRELEKQVKLDSNLPPSHPLASPDRKVVVHDDQGGETVPTGNSTVPYFPRLINLPALTSPSSAASEKQVAPTDMTEYALIGLGPRTVTFLNFQVYVVGYYVASADLPALQAALAKHAPSGTDLKTALLDPATGEQTWSALLESGVPARSAFRIVPVRDTDFHHLRDGFVRAIQARAPAGAAEDEAFGEAVRTFRSAFNRGSVPKRRELLLVRDDKGRLSIAYDGGVAGDKKKKGQREVIGTVEDERVSRALWLNWLAGKKVASEPARQNIVDRIVALASKP
ncbi:hypothetical protein VTJ04DRAFT_7691 [Mycothermus thermophilus]|uniref:uncharacterized protein n=1 Tax=Humicola insolens TaxID=85995 RepID=UPI0037423BF0